MVTRVRAGRTLPSIRNPARKTKFFSHAANRRASMGLTASGHVCRFLVVFSFFSVCAAQAPSPATRTPVVHQPELFAPGVISTGDFDSHIEFTPDGNTLYFLRSLPNFAFWTIYESHFRSGRW